MSNFCNIFILLKAYQALPEGQPFTDVLVTPSQSPIPFTVIRKPLDLSQARTSGRKLAHAFGPFLKDLMDSILPILSDEQRAVLGQDIDSLMEQLRVEAGAVGNN